MKAMAKKPDQRYNSAGAFALALRQAVAEELGEQFLRVEPTPSTLPPVGEKHTTASRKLDKEEDGAKTTAAKTIPEQPQPGDQIPSMSTVLMDAKTNHAPNPAIGAAPQIPEQTKTVSRRSQP